MAFLDSKRDRAALLIFVLGVGLVWTLWPFISGLLGAPVLYVVFAPVHRWLAQRIVRFIATTGCYFSPNPAGSPCGSFGF